MSPVRALRLRGAATRTASLGRLVVLVLAVLATLGIYVVGAAVEGSADAPLLLLVVPLALAAIAYGKRGGIGMGVLASLAAAAWWVEQGRHGGPAWFSSLVITCLLIGALLGWLVDSRQALARAIARHRELSLNMIATANFDGYFTDQNRYRSNDGSYRWLEWTSRPDSNGRTLIAVARDVTDRKRLELEREYQQRLERNVRERTKELNRRNAELEEARRETLRRLALAASTGTTRRSSTPSAFVTAPRFWPRRSGARRAGSSSFGMALRCMTSGSSESPTPSC